MEIEVKLGLIWGTVIVLVLALVVTWAVVASTPRGAKGWIGCDMTDNNSQTVTIVCTSGRPDAP